MPPRQRRLTYRPRTVCLLVLLVTLLGSPPAKISAQPLSQDPFVTSFVQRDVNSDGLPDEAVIVSNHVTDRDIVTVYDQGHDMSWATDWQAGTDFVNDVWVFQPGGTNRAKLLILFSQEPEGYAADLFDDVDGDGTVSYRLEDNGQVIVNEATFPSVRVVGEQPWSLPAGAINYLVKVTIFRPMYATGAEFPVMLPQDGRPAIEKEIVDSDGDQIPDYELVQVFPDIPPERLVTRTYLNVNVDHVQPQDFEGFFLWPYLGYASSQSWTEDEVFRPVDDFSPPIQVDWEKGKIKAVGDFLPRWGPEMHWLFNSHIAIEREAVNTLDFERFGHYNFSGADYPDMIIRFSMAQAGFDESVRQGDRTLHTYQVALTWHQQDKAGSLAFDYKLELAGLHEAAPTVVQFRDFSLREIPYEDWPWWFTEQEWAYATFVATEGLPYMTNEQIYEWNTVEAAYLDVETYEQVPGASLGQRAYLLGWTDETPAKFYPSIREGLRGEYAELNGPAGLYFSPVDHKLHLSRPHHGVWNITGPSEIRYANLDNDAYFDQWQYLENGELRSQLNVTDGTLIYGGDGLIVVKEADPEPALFETLPPRNRQEWLLLDEQLKANQPQFEPHDLGAMAMQFEGPTFRLEGASMEDFRLTGDGFRFVIDLVPGYQLNTEIPVTGSDLQAPGSYVLEGDRTTLSLRAATPPALSLAGDQIDSIPSGEIRELETVHVNLSVVNTGLRDAHSVPLVLTLQGPEDLTEVITQTVELVPGEGACDVSIPWTPMQDGDWVVGAELGSQFSLLLQGQVSAAVDVQPAETWSLQRLLSVPYPIQRFLVPTLLVIIALLAAGIATRVLTMQDDRT